ncbi:sigma-70 family RNA polymerase sigma factor [candidate division KSB1 bacterium]|nr:sigma-70 family RNA polymerase sigma factor [candidate division KSB1 bacterium]
MTDTELVKQAMEGNERAFADLVRRHESRVAATVYGMLGDCPEAEDIGQETFIRFYRALPRFRGESTVATYLTRIAINLSLNELKRRKRRRLLGLHSIDESEAPTVRIENPEWREVLQRALQRLDPLFRTVVVLRWIEGYSTRETAEILDVPEGTVLSRLARAQKKLQHMLAPYHEAGIAARPIHSPDTDVQPRPVG